MLDLADRTSRFLAEREAQVSRGVSSAHPLVLERALGGEVWDVDGKRYLDFVAGIGVLNVGHNNPRVVRAVREQLEKLSHVAFQVASYPPYLELARRLNALMGPGHKTILLSSGAEAVENAIKIARARTNRPAVIAFRGGFHGRTLLAMTLTGMNVPYRQNFGPFAPEVFHVPFPNSFRGCPPEASLAALCDLFASEVSPDRVAAIVVEVVQGDGGFLPAPPAFLQALQDLARQHGIVFIVDEIQSGFGRTGSMFAFEQAGIKPDLVTLAKSLAGGLPLSAVVGRADVMDAPAPGGLGGTYGGNALSCAAALAVLDAFEQDGLLARAKNLGAALQHGLQALQHRYSQIGEVRGLGFMQAIEIVHPDGSPDAALVARVLDAARERGLLLIKCGIPGNVIRFLAPLVITDAQLAEGLAILDDALRASIGKESR